MRRSSILLESETRRLAAASDRSYVRRRTPTSPQPGELRSQGFAGVLPPAPRWCVHPQLTPGRLIAPCPGALRAWSAMEASNPRPPRKGLVVTLVVLGTLAGFLALPALWLNRQLLNTDNWTATSSELLGRPRVQQLWEDANRAASTALLKVVDGGGDNVSTDNGTVKLDLRNILVEASATLGVGQQLVAQIPEGSAQITVLKSDQ